MLHCNVIKDLLPLYAEGIASQESRALVEEHLAVCEGCLGELRGMREDHALPADTDASPLKAISRKLRIGRIRVATLAALVTLLATVLAVVYMTAPHYLPYSQDRLAFAREADGRVIAVFGEDVTGYDLWRSSGPDTAEAYYSITVWNSLWDRLLGKRPGDAVLNPDLSEVNAVYYYTADDSDDRLVYGTDLLPTGGMKTLPRLALSYYLLMAGAAAIMLGVALLLTRRWERVKGILGKIVPIPIAYIISHFLIMGAKSATYSILRDFAGILLTMIPVYLILLWAGSLFAGRARHGADA